MFFLVLPFLFKYCRLYDQKYSIQSFPCSHPKWKHKITVYIDISHLLKRVEHVIIIYRKCLDMEFPTFVSCI